MISTGQLQIEASQAECPSVHDVPRAEPFPPELQKEHQSGMMPSHKRTMYEGNTHYTPSARLICASVPGAREGDMETASLLHATCREANLVSEQKSLEPK